MSSRKVAKKSSLLGCREGGNVEKDVIQQEYGGGEVGEGREEEREEEKAEEEELFFLNCGPPFFPINSQTPMEMRPSSEEHDSVFFFFSTTTSCCSCS